MAMLWHLNCDVKAVLYHMRWVGDVYHMSWVGDVCHMCWVGDVYHMSWVGDVCHMCWVGDVYHMSRWCVFTCVEEAMCITKCWGGDVYHICWVGDVYHTCWGGDVYHMCRVGEFSIESAFWSFIKKNRKNILTACKFWNERVVGTLLLCPNMIPVSSNCYHLWRFFVICLLFARMLDKMQR